MGHWRTCPQSSSLSLHSVKFTRVPNFSISQNDNSTLFCRHFPHLTVYRLDCSDLSAHQLAGHFRALSTLLNLQFLTLQPFLVVSPQLEATFVHLPPLISLKMLTLVLWTLNRHTIEDHHRLEASFWATLFPSVHIIEIAHDGAFCTICYPAEDEKARMKLAIDYAQLTPCLTQLLAPLKVAPSLRKIFYQRAQQPGYTAEFTSEGTFVWTHKYVC